MSYDGWILMADPDGGDPIELAEFGNYTSNVSRMWGWCLSLVLETPTRLSDTEEWSCEKAAPVLAKAVTVMEANRDRLSQWNPENGWGDYDGALDYLRRVADLARQYRGIPATQIHWWV